MSFTAVQGTSLPLPFHSLPLQHATTVVLAQALAMATAGRACRRTCCHRPLKSVCRSVLRILVPLAGQATPPFAVGDRSKLVTSDRYIQKIPKEILVVLVNQLK